MRRQLPRPAQRHGHCIVRWQRLVLALAGALLTATGVVWLAVHFGIGAGAGALPHPAEAWSMRLHGLGAFAALFALGAFAAAHVPQGWRLSQRRRWTGQRRTGIALCCLAAVLVLSGYVLYYFASEATRPAIGWAHAGAGLAMSLLVAAHRRGVRG